MNDMTRLKRAAADGDPQAALELVRQRLRRDDTAAARRAALAYVEAVGHVHETVVWRHETWRESQCFEEALMLITQGLGRVSLVIGADALTLECSWDKHLARAFACDCVRHALLGLLEQGVSDDLEAWAHHALDQVEASRKRMGSARSKQLRFMPGMRRMSARNLSPPKTFGEKLYWAAQSACFEEPESAAGRAAWRTREADVVTLCGLDDPKLWQRRRLAAYLLGEVELRPR